MSCENDLAENDVKYIPPHLRLSCRCNGKKQFNEMEEDHLGKSYSDSKELKLPGKLDSGMAVGTVDRREAMVDALSFSRQYEELDLNIEFIMTLFDREDHVEERHSKPCGYQFWLSPGAFLARSMFFDGKFKQRTVPPCCDSMKMYLPDVLQRRLVWDDMIRRPSGSQSRILSKGYKSRNCTETTDQRPATKGLVYGNTLGFDNIDRCPASEPAPRPFRNTNLAERTKRASMLAPNFWDPKLAEPNFRRMDFRMKCARSQNPVVLAWKREIVQELDS
ncbi:hypothetical protein EV421DRAFT_1735930 [Armillaria borealis]|uniref:Uncharacterized protein n=1 Tax=Armillaria borealis TaxID=47425 RepID=A0AA39JI26_9AGAR|nr:hypothetical protein EV421DRAFT_1735930 [Armillaria borealis]